MRLLNFEGGTFDHGRATLVEYHGRDIPRYGILSHTWGEDNAEVTFEDAIKGTGWHKSGYDKIRFCGEKANEQLQYFWVDTCCIDKSNSVELQEAINSMFRWYQNAAVCYVYLSDVASKGREYSYTSWQCSEWFKRGWTLQELLAPKSVEFFSVDRNYLRNRESQAPRIYGWSGIHGEALHGRALASFSVDERLRWAVQRKTTREEDVAYCLLGLFDVQMPVRYGEGREQALLRLQKQISEAQESKGHIKPAVKFISRLIRVGNKPVLGTRWRLSPIERWLYTR
ncbi:heterokaryon incompatibility protein-domain-containing protein [Massariosphaeria phaeospora]|uniref:Heterokaryon incompatibility protein-domain-containing protein n=1 Tax=Massariosphaeria phaeospora TaxID=100035 RepID=A0A7C8I5T0_9PLEO|nr:heterokaryon incompatibility protein-domain-containing protein [Massariosphaeria phaeospora]